MEPRHPFDSLDVAAQPRELVAVGGTLSPDTLRAAYRNGVFPWPASAEDEAGQDRVLRRLARRGQVLVLPGTPEGPLVPWVSPHPRALLVTSQLKVPKSLRQLLRRTTWTTTLDAAFEEVVAACADRDSTWITPRMVAGYTALHREGGAHSVEVWDGDRLVGGLYGVLAGWVFSGESMFFRESGASKAAVIDLCRRLDSVGVQVLDTQQESAHLRALGQVLVHRAEYVELVRSLQGPSPELPKERRSAVV
jgi:leucyl/phenylalanyl-tRNA--protein transferase